MTAIAAVCAAASCNLDSGNIVKACRLKHDLAAGAAGGELSPLAAIWEFAPSGELIGSNKFDDALLVAHGVGLNEAVLIYRLRVQPNGAATINELATGTDHDAVSRRQVD